MGKRQYLEKTSLRERKWDKIFNALVKLTQNLEGDRKILEERVKHLHGVIYKIKTEQKVDSLKAELILGFKERDSIVYKHRYENAEYDLADFRDLCDYLAQKCSGPTDITIDNSKKGEGSRNKALQDEVRKLKSEIESHKMEKNSEIAVLLAEKNFVWNQYKQLESSFTEQLRKKCDEVENANEKVLMLVSRADEMHILNEQLRANITKLESESIQKNEEILNLMKEIEILKSRSASASTLLHPCRAEPISSSSQGKNRSSTGRSIAKVKTESDPSQTSEKITGRKPSAHKSTGGKAPRKQLMAKGSSSSKRKEVDTPKLFTSSFKVPKLKNSSSPQIV